MSEITLKSKIGKRYLSIAEPHVEVCEDCEKLIEASDTYFKEYNTFYDALQKKGIVIKSNDANKQNVIIDKQDLDAELMQKLNAVAEVSNRYVSAGKKAGTASKKLMDLATACSNTRDRINIQRLKEQHANTLLDNLEKEALKTQADYWESKKNYENCYTEFIELKKGFDAFLK